MPRNLLPALIASLLVPATAAAEGWSVEPAGYLQHDYGRYEIGGDSGDTGAPRRTRLGLKADHASGVKLRLEWDFIGGTVADAYVEFPAGQGSSLRFGQYKQPFSLEEQGSSKETAMLELSQLHDAFNYNRRVGLMWIAPIGASTLQLSAFGGNAENPSEARGVAARVYGNPYGNKNLHLGVSLSQENRADDLLRLRARPETRLLPWTPVDSGRRIEPDASRRIGLESAWLKESFTLQAEFAALRGDGRNQLEGEAAYVQASWLSGGASRSFKDGAVRAPKLSADSRLYEFSARLSRADIDYGSQHLGAQTQFSLGASAMLGKHVQLSLEQGWFDAERSVALSRPGPVDGDVTTLRLQLAF